MADEFSANGKTFTTSRGMIVRFKGVTTAAEELRASFMARIPEEPSPPKYKVESELTGVVQWFEHNETTLTTDVERAEYAKYLEARTQYLNTYNEIEAKLNAAIVNLILLRGVDVEMPNDAWIKEHELIGYSVPTDPTERRLHWLKTEVVGGLDDVEAIVLGAMSAGNTSKELLASVEDSFRSHLDQSNRRETKETERPQAEDNNKRDMELQPALRAGSDSLRTENTAIPV